MSVARTDDVQVMLCHTLGLSKLAPYRQNTNAACTRCARGMWVPVGHADCPISLLLTVSLRAKEVRGTCTFHVNSTNGLFREKFCRTHLHLTSLYFPLRVSQWCLTTFGPQHVCCHLCPMGSLGGQQSQSFVLVTCVRRTDLSIFHATLFHP